MAALLTAEVKAIAQHFIDYVFVAHRGAHYCSPGSLDGRIQTGVAHYGADESFLGQQTLPQQIQTRNSHDIVAIDKLAVLVTEQNAIGITIMSDAEVCAMLPNFLANQSGMKRAAFFVD